MTAIVFHSSDWLFFRMKQVGQRSNLNFTQVEAENLKKKSTNHIVDAKDVTYAAFIRDFRIALSNSIMSVFGNCLYLYSILHI